MKAFSKTSVVLMISILFDAESDRQKHHAVGLSMSVTAMEALVRLKGSDLTKMFASHAARFLEPELARRADAENYFTNLYGARSLLLHGSSLEGDADKRREARLLAGAMLKAVQEWHDIRRRIQGQPEKPDALREALKVDKYKHGLLDGVLESPVRTLWGRTDAE